MEMFESLEKNMCKELEALDQKIKSGTEMSMQDLEKADKLAHALKSLATYSAMKGAEECHDWDGGNGMSGHAHPETDKYAEAYNRGYHEGMRAGQNQSNMSGFYPPVRPYPDRFRY